MKNFAGIFSALIFISALLTGAEVYAQNTDSVNTYVRTALTNHYKKYPQEKVFIHTDADLYANGQTIWYKVYASAYGKPTELSRIAYVVLTDSTGKVVLKNKLPINGGTAHGNLDLPDSLHSGWYQLTGLTAWMMNFDEAGLFHKRIYVQNLAEKLPAPSDANNETKYHILFYPEGGDLVEGTLCNIAFKAWDDKGLPVKVEGEIISSDNAQIAKLKTIHDGMGDFEMEGFSIKNYTAKVRFPDQSEQTIALPPFKKQGLVLKVNSLPADVIEVRLSVGNGLEKYRNIVVAAFQENGTIKTFPLVLNQGINLINLNKSDFATGILRITAFNDKGVPLAERIAFINRDDQLKLSLKASGLSFDPRAKSTFKLTAELSAREPIAGNFSVAITDADAVGASEDDNIYTSLLISAELQGKIYHPGYYFQNKSDSLKQQLDLVMLTNGWRHFKWDMILNDQPFALKYFVESTQFLVGKIENYKEQDKLKVKLIVSNDDSTKYAGVIEPDTAGNFVLRDYKYRGTAQIMYQVIGKKNKRQHGSIKFLNSGIDNSSFWVDTLDCFTQPKLSADGLFLSDAFAAKSDKAFANSILLKTVNVKEHRTPLQMVVENHVKHLEATNAYDFDLLNETPGPSGGPMGGGVLSYLQGKVPGLDISIDPATGVHYKYHGASSIFGAGNEPIFYVDEAMSDFEDISSIPMTDIALVRFVPPPVPFAPMNGGFIGAIMVYTKNGNDLKGRVNPLFGHYQFNGYSITREFASPDYGSSKPGPKTDTRTTLYWQHDLETDNFGSSKFHFYNSDKAKHYRVVIQGMDAQGRIGYLNEVF